MNNTRTRKKKKNDLQIYHLKETDKFLKLTEKKDYTKDDNSRVEIIIEYIILYNGEVTATKEIKEYNSKGKIIFLESKIMDKFLIPKRRFKELKKWTCKGLPYQIVKGPLLPTDVSYFKRYNDECFTRCTIRWYTGYNKNPIKKIVNDYYLTYPFILSFIRPYSKLNRQSMSNLSSVIENII